MILRNKKENSIDGFNMNTYACMISILQHGISFVVITLGNRIRKYDAYLIK
jgi:hypothetical protein